MSKRTTESMGKSSPEWDELEGWLRGSMQNLIQQVLEEEVTEFFGRAKSARRSEGDSDSGYRNGHGRPRKLTLSGGTVELRRPRVRNTDERFESRLLPLFAKRTAKVSELIPQLYLHGLSEGDFDLALRGLLGEDAPLSAATVARLKERWNGELAEWRSRRLDEHEVVYVWVDGVYVKAGLEREKAAILVVIGVLSDGTKTVLSVVSGLQGIDARAGREALRDLRDRGMNCPKTGGRRRSPGHLGSVGATCIRTPGSRGCWNHKIINVLDKLPKRQHEQAKLMLRGIPYAGSRAESERLRSLFCGWCRERSYDGAAESLERDWDRMVTFL